MRRRGRWIAALTVLAVCGAPFLARAQFYASPVDPALEPYASTADSVTLPDGRRLHLVCMGQGSPTVVLTAGLGDWSGPAWEHFQPEAAKITRVCSWDRPGFGLSDGVAGKVTVATNTADLEAALAKGPIPGPYIMVGHSLGAYETLLFTDRNRAKVAGMVLVDPSYPGQGAKAIEFRARFHLEDPGPQPDVALWRQCAAEVRSGALRATGPDPDHCLTFPGFPRALRAAMTAQHTASPLPFETAASFLADGMWEGSDAVINPARDYGDLPLVVLTATAPPPGAAAVDPARQAASDAIWSQEHDKLAALSRRGANIRVEGAAHYIQRDNPKAVLDAIQSVIRQARGASK